MVPDIALGAIVASLIAAVASLLSLVITKEMKISEFRQAWVNELRDDIADAISAVATINLLFGSDHQSQLKAEFVEAWSKTSAALARVELRLNLTEAPHQELAALIREAEALIRQGEVGTFDQAKAENLQDRVVQQTQSILKIEWDRVRVGEPTFKAAKKLSAGVALVVFLILILAYFSNAPVTKKIEGPCVASQPLNDPSPSAKTNAPKLD